jgi:hypothetical protein
LTLDWKKNCRAERPHRSTALCSSHPRTHRSRSISKSKMQSVSMRARAGRICGAPWLGEDTSAASGMACVATRAPGSRTRAARLEGRWVGVVRSGVAGWVGNWKESQYLGRIRMLQIIGPVGLKSKWVSFFVRWISSVKKAKNRTNLNHFDY